MGEDREGEEETVIKQVHCIVNGESVIFFIDDSSEVISQAGKKKGNP
jgi:hypothetical protein